MDALITEVGFVKVVIVSDSHGNMGALKGIIQREAPFDLMFHLGDGIEEAIRLQTLFGFNLDGVEGNNDLKEVFPTSLVLKFGKKRCFFTHGHLYDVHRDRSLLMAQARIAKAELVFFGHTHHYYDGFQKGFRLINPGTVCQHLSKEAGYLILRVEAEQIKVEKITI